MGKRRRRLKQTSLWMATQDLPRTGGHPFYTRLNQILDQADFDGYVEALCQRFYADEVGRPGLPPGRYFRLLLIGYFEGLDAERAITWRAADSFALHDFLGLVLSEAPPDHSTISRTRRLIDLEAHEAIFTWILQRLADAGLVKGKTIGIDATTLEANAEKRRPGWPCAARLPRRVRVNSIRQSPSAFETDNRRPVKLIAAIHEPENSEPL